MTEWRIRCPDLDAEWSAEDGESLLESAERAGIGLLSSCRNGTCRACMCRLIAGEVRYRIEWPGLSREEKAEGWVLPCVAEPISDGVVEPLTVVKLFQKTLFPQPSD